MIDPTTLEVVQRLVAELSLFLSLLFIASAVHKGMQFTRARSAARALAGLSKSMACVAVIITGLWEISASALLWFPGKRATGALLGAGILVVYLLLVSRAILEDRRNIDCGCRFGTAHSMLGTFEVVRNSCLVAAALLIAVLAPDGLMGPAYADLLPGVALLAIYYALDEVMGARPPTTERALT